MASPIIPKEQLTAYQRWELLGFDEAGPAPVHETVVADDDEPVVVTLPTAEEIERIHQQAAQEGFRIGRDEGYKAGYDAGRRAAEEMAGRLTALADELDRERVLRDEEIARELLELALTVARQMVRVAVRVKPALVLEVIREAMTALPSLTGHLRILVHTDDVEPLREFMESEHAHFSFKVVADSRIERGGFRIESSHSEVDGQLPIRWREIVDCLGNESGWLE